MKTISALIYRIVLGAVLVLLAGLALVQFIPPRAVPSDAPATRFSAERAMIDLEIIAREPHGAGSAAQERVRSYIVTQIEALGLDAEIETSGQASNILVRLSGTDPTRTVLVTGHYDSHPPSPGAGDNGISVAAMLESIRVLHASPALRNDVLFLYTDGEELGYLGARAYIRAHPEAKTETGVLLVFDARPGNAPLNLLETTSGDAWLLHQMIGLRLPLWTGSWKNLQERQELDTDFDTFQPAGYTGMAFENEANGTRYHTARDTVDAISPRLVQAYGQTMLALTERFGSIDLGARSEGPDLVFFTLPFIGLVAYPYWVMLGLSCLGILALLVFVMIAWRRKRFALKRFLLSLSGLVVGILLVVLLAQLAWSVIKGGYKMELAAYDGFEGSALRQAGLMIMAGLLVILLLTVLSRRCGAIHLAPAATVLFLLAGFAFSTMTGNDNPLTTAWLAWPFLGCVAGMGTLLFIKDRIWQLVLLSLSSLMLVAVTLPRLWMAAYTREDAWLTVLVVSVWVALFAPQIEAVLGKAPEKV